MTEAVATGPSLSESVSKIVESINQVSGSLFSLFQAGFDQVADFSRNVVTSLTDKWAINFADIAIDSLVKLRLHIQDLANNFHAGSLSFDKKQLHTLLLQKEKMLADHMDSNSSFARIYGRYVNGSIKPHLDTLKNNCWSA